MENFSEEGALFTILAEGGVSTADLGVDAFFILRSASAARKYTGEVIRLYFRDGSAHIALRFWEKPAEVPKGSCP